MERFTQDESRWMKGPYLQLGLPFRAGAAGKNYFDGFETEHPSFVHQETAWNRLASNRVAQSTIVATGTGSGKTECFLYPVLDHCMRAKASGHGGVKALVIYPMNALATDQAARFAKRIALTPAFKGLRVGLYVGGMAGKDGRGEVRMTAEKVITDRETLRRDPPDILLTNYKMLDYLLIRPKDSKLWAKNTPEMLRYIIVDELHTFDGAQGTDSQMVRSLISGRPMNAVNGTVDRTNVTSAQQAPNRVEADSLWYLRIGYGLALGPTTGYGVAFGFGYRYELDELGIELSFLNLVIGNNNNSSGSATVTGDWAKIMGLYFLSPISTGSFYLGGGLSWGMAAAAGNATGATGSTSSFETYTGSGLQGELSVGYEFLRASTIRMFLQADATLPFYTVHRYTFDDTTGAMQSASSWVPSLAFSFGIGWGRSITRVHVVE